MTKTDHKIFREISGIPGTFPGVPGKFSGAPAIIIYRLLFTITLHVRRESPRLYRLRRVAK